MFLSQSAQYLAEIAVARAIFPYERPGYYRRKPKDTKLQKLEKPIENTIGKMLIGRWL